MRIIKLSKNDVDFANRVQVDVFFEITLKNKTLEGRFELTNSRIAKNGIAPKEKLVFTYKGEIVYLAEAASKRLPNNGDQSDIYPYCFYVDMKSVRPGQGSLASLEAKLKEKGLIQKNIVKSQGWPIVPEDNIQAGAIESILSLFEK